MRISKFISRAVCSSLLFLLPLLSVAQRRQMVAEVDSVPTFRGLAVSVDAVGLVQQATGSYGQIEGALRVNLKDRYFPIVEIGYGKADADDASTQLIYKTSAPYGRVGIDFNMLRQKHDIYRLYIGGRYAFTSFSYDVDSPPVSDPVWGGEATYHISGEKANCHWLEAVVGIDAQIWRHLRMGWSVRYKLRLAHDDGDAGNVWYVPGYGKEGGTRLGGTFNVIFEL